MGKLDGRVTFRMLPPWTARAVECMERLAMELDRTGVDVAAANLEDAGELGGR